MTACRRLSMVELAQYLLSISSSSGLTNGSCLNTLVFHPAPLAHTTAAHLDISASSALTFIYLSNTPDQTKYLSFPIVPVFFEPGLGTI